MKKSQAILNLIAIIITLILIGIAIWQPLAKTLENREEIKSFILGYGPLAPIILIIIIALQVLFAPIPGQTAGLASGYLFGPISGTLYSMIGLIIGSYIVFSLSRKFGRPFVEKFVKQDTLKKFDHFSSENGLLTLFIIYLLPALPDDAICYMAGLTNIKIKNLMIVSAIGRLPGFIVLNLVGAGLASQNSQFTISLFVTFTIISIFLFLYKNEIEKLTIRVINKFKHKDKLQG